MVDEINVAVPKGRICDDLVPFLQNRGAKIEDEFFDKNTRRLKFSATLGDLNLNLFPVRSFDVAEFVSSDVCDVGFCGSDVFEEYILANDNHNLSCSLKTDIGLCRLSLAGFEMKNDPIYVKIATKYPFVAMKFANCNFVNRNIKIIKLNGAIETAVLLGMSDYIIDLVSSGKTLKENNMIELQKICDVRTLVLCNKNSMRYNGSFIQKFLSSIY